MGAEGAVPRSGPDEPAPPAGVLDETFLARLDAIPYAPREVWRDPRYYYIVTRGALDFVAHNTPHVNDLLVRLNPYPKPFERVRVPVGEDGVTLGAWYGKGRGKLAVLYAPGTFQTKDDSTRKSKAIRLWREWGASVLVVDLRGFGDSHGAWGTGGYLEAHDLQAAARWLLARCGAERALLMGDSLGGSSAFIASALPGADALFAGTLAWSPFADLEIQSRYATTNPGLRHPYYVPYTMYRLMVYARSRGEARDFNDFIRLRSAMLGLEPQELVRRSSAVNYASHVAVPTLVHAAEDDPIVPVDQARYLEEASRGNPRVAVRILPRGGHVAFEEHDRAWYWRVVRAMVEHVLPDSLPKEGAR